MRMMKRAAATIGLAILLSSGADIPSLAATPEVTQQLVAQRARLEAAMAAQTEAVKASFARGEIPEGLFRKLEAIQRTKGPFLLGMFDRVIRGEITVAQFAEQAATKPLFETKVEGETISTVSEKFLQGKIPPADVLRINTEIEYEFYVKSGRFGAPPPVAPPADDPVAKMKKLKELRDQGIITKEDYDAKKAEVLKSL